jgi:hypothetical protein
MAGGNPALGGTVVAVFPAIGMVDVQLPHGAVRYPVEDLAIDTSDNFENLTDYQADSVPGGTPTVSVPGGPDTLAKDVRDPLTQEFLDREASASRVLEAYVKTALYWNAPDRKYRMCKVDLAAGVPSCPRCEGTPLRKVIYKREDGRNEKLHACPECLFMIKSSDIIGMEG